MTNIIVATITLTNLLDSQVSPSPGLSPFLYINRALQFIMRREAMKVALFTPRSCSSDDDLWPTNDA